MYSKLKPILLSLPMAVLFVLFQQCSGVNFNNTNKQNQWSNECAKDTSKCRVVTENFNAGSSNKKIDFTWIVDNSASMAEEVARVQNNMAAFANQLGTYTDLKMALVSAKDATTNQGFQSNAKYFSLPTMPGNVQSLQVNTLVKSRDALIVGGLSMCPTSGADANSWCSTFQANKVDSEGKTINANQWNIQYSSATSKVANFVREQSHKVFVIVSDDDATVGVGEYHVKSEQFLDAYDSRFPNSQPIVYAIASPRNVADAKAAGCAVYNQAIEYNKLTQLTGGKLFDICATDWTPYFTEMLNGISILANTSFPLATVNVVDIISVKVNGNVLNPGDYTYANRTLKIRADIMAGYTNYNIEVEVLEYIK